MLIEETARNVRQWRREIKEKCMPLMENTREYSKAYDEKQRQINDKIEGKKPRSRA